MMPPGRPPIQSYGPSLLDTVERGDIFFSYRDQRKRLEVVGKVYNDDLSVTYVLESAARRLHFIDEAVLLKRGSGGYQRSHKTVRNPMKVTVKWNSLKPTATSE